MTVKLTFKYRLFFKDDKGEAIEIRSDPEWKIETISIDEFAQTVRETTERFIKMVKESQE